MKTLLATTAAILITTSTAFADPTGGSTTGGTGTDPTNAYAEQIEMLEAQLAEANNVIDGLTDYNNVLLEDNVTFNDEIHHVNDVIANSSGYDSFGDVWSTFGYQGLTPTSEKLYKDHSYDNGTTITSFTGTTVTNVNVKGKYHDFDISTDVQLVDVAHNKLAFMNVIEQVKNISYNEGYKDGFNDGYEKGFYDGKQSILNQLK